MPPVFRVALLTPVLSDIKALLNPYSNTVCMERPNNQAFIQRWQLACKGDIAHVVCMPSSSEEKLDEFFNEYLAVAQQNNKK